MFSFSPSFRAAAVLVVGLAVITLAAEPAPAPTVIRETAFTFYRSFSRPTKTPRFVSRQIAVLCAMPNTMTVEQDREKNGPHAQARIHLYVNPAAEETIKHTKETTFPVGAVVIKEKLAQDDSAEAVGGMIKRAHGYDPQHGDWEYFYCEKNGELTSGRLANCISCHSGPQAIDHVFSVWSAEEKSP